jgi:hypothetical protein
MVVGPFPMTLPLWQRCTVLRLGLDLNVSALHCQRENAHGHTAQTGTGTFVWLSTFALRSPRRFVRRKVAQLAPSFGHSNMSFKWKSCQREDVFVRLVDLCHVRVIDLINSYEQPGA